MQEVIPTTEARSNLSATVRRFRNEGKDAAPVVFGTHRRAEGVMLAYEAYEKLLSRLEDLEIAQQVRAREVEAGSERLTLEEALERAGLSHLAD